MIEKYVNSKKFDRTQLAIDVKNGKVSKESLDIIFKEIDDAVLRYEIDNPCIGTSPSGKRSKSEWNEKYLGLLVSEVSSAEVFNKESMLYLLEVSKHVNSSSLSRIVDYVSPSKKIKQLEEKNDYLTAENEKLRLTNLEQLKTIDKQQAVIFAVSMLTGNVKFADADTAKKKCFCWFGYKRKRIKQLEKENAELLAVVADIKKLVDEASSSYVQKLLGVEVNTLEYKPEGTEN